MIGRQLAEHLRAHVGDTTRLQSPAGPAINEHLADNDWLTLIEETASAAAGALDKPDRIAQRAARAPGDPRAAHTITALLGNDPKPWDLQRIGDAGLEVLPSATGNAARELRERLLERGFHEALGL